MATDVIDLRDFYATPLGRTAERFISRRLHRMWPRLEGGTLLGVGYATPFLKDYSEQVDRAIAAMPAQQGVIHWPPHGPGRTVLTDETALPFEDASVERILVVHALERTQPAEPLLREIWRVLAGQGRVLFIVPHRTGIWARMDHTPFGHGHPYSDRQLSRLLRMSMFIPERMEHALFVPPSHRRVVLGSAAAWENIGRRWLSGFAGVTLLEASKQVFARPKRGRRAPRREPVLAPAPVRQGATARVPGARGRVTGVRRPGLLTRQDRER